MPRSEKNGTYTYTFSGNNDKIVYNSENVAEGYNQIKNGQKCMDADADDIFDQVKKLKYSNYIARGMGQYDEYYLRSIFSELLYRTKKLAIGIWDKNYRLDVYSIKDVNDQYHLNSSDNKNKSGYDGLSFERVMRIISTIKNGIEQYSAGYDINTESTDNIMHSQLLERVSGASSLLGGEKYSIDTDVLDNRKFQLFKLQNSNDKRVESWDINTYKEYLKSGKDLNTFINDKTKLSEGTDKTQRVYINQDTKQVGGFSSKAEVKTDTEKANTGTTNTGKTDTSKTDTSKNDTTKTDTSKTEPAKDTDTKTPDTKEPDKTIENKPQPDAPTTITDNKGSSGVSHGSSSSNNNGNYTFTNSGISASQDEPIESLTDENPTEGSGTTLPVDEEDVYTIPTDLSGVTSKTKHSSGGSGVLPIIGGLGAAAAVGVGAKIYMDNKKNNDNGEDSDETDGISDTDEWSETTDGNDGILADEWNEDDSNFEFEDAEADSDDDESGFGEI